MIKTSKNVKILAVLILTMLVFTTLLPFTVFAAKEEYKTVYDRVNILTDEEERQIEKAADEYYGKSDIKVYIVTDNTPNVDYWGEDFIKEYGIKGSCVVLIITDNQFKNYNMYKYGKAGSRFSKGEIDAILDSSLVYPQIKSGKYAEGAIGFIQVSSEFCGKPVMTITLVTVLSALIAAGCTYGGIYYSYHRKMRSEKYPLDHFAKLDLQNHRDMFITSFVTKRTIQSSNNGSGSGSSGGGGGGGSGHCGGR